MSASRDERMQLILEIKSGKKSQPIRYKTTILSQEDIEPMISQTLGQIDDTLISAEIVQVVAYVVKAGGRPSCHQEHPCRTSNIKSLTPILTRGLKAALTEPDKEDLDVQLNRGVSRLGNIGSTGLKTFMQIKSGVQALQASGILGGPPNPAAMMGAIKDGIATFGNDGDSGSGGGGDIMGMVMQMLSNPNAASGPEMLNGLLGGLAKDPETAPLATMLGGLLNGLK